jgi:hypothetical protein
VRNVTSVTRTADCRDCASSFKLQDGILGGLNPEIESKGRRPKPSKRPRKPVRRRGHHVGHGEDDSGDEVTCAHLCKERSWDLCHNSDCYAARVHGQALQAVGMRGAAALSTGERTFGYFAVELGQVYTSLLIGIGEFAGCARQDPHFCEVPEMEMTEDVNVSWHLAKGHTEMVGQQDKLRLRGEHPSTFHEILRVRTAPSCGRRPLGPIRSGS